MSSKRLLSADLRGEDPFKTLGIQIPAIESYDDEPIFREALSESVIKKAYRTQARLIHPDKNPDDLKAKEKFDSLQKAYEWIIESGNREDYISALLKEKVARKRYALRDSEKNKLASSLAEREKAAADARGRYQGGSGNKAARSAADRYTAWVKKQEELSEKLQANADADDAAYNLIKRLKKTTGEGSTSGTSSGMTTSFTPSNVARDTWTTIGSNETSSSMFNSTHNDVINSNNRIDFKGKWRNPVFLKESIAGSKDIFLAFEKDTLDLLKTSINT